MFQLTTGGAATSGGLIFGVGDAYMISLRLNAIREAVEHPAVMSPASRSSTSHLGAELVRSLRGPGVFVLFLVLSEFLRRGARALGFSTWAPALGWGTAFTLLGLVALARHRVRFTGRWLATVAGAWVAAFALTWLIRQV